MIVLPIPEFTNFKQEIPLYVQGNGALNDLIIIPLGGRRKSSPEFI